MHEPKFEPKREKQILQHDSPKWADFMKWCEQGLVGKIMEARGYDFRGMGPLYRATINKFGVDDYVGGEQFVFTLNTGRDGDMEEYNKKTEQWEPCNNVTLAVQGHTVNGVTRVGNDLLIGHGKVLSVDIPDEFFE